MKKIILLLILFFSYGFSFGQTAAGSIKYPVKNKQLIIDVQDASITIEGYNGNELIIEPTIMTVAVNIPPEATGFSLIASAIKKEDNIIHAEVVKNDIGILSLRILKSNCRHLHIKVPKSAYLKVSFTNPWPDARASFKNLSGVLEVDGSAQVITFNYITGPLTLSAGGSGLKAGASDKIIVANLQIPKGTGAVFPFLNIQASYADVDVSLPADTRESLQVLVATGKFFSDLGLVLNSPIIPPAKGEFLSELNGGGRMVSIHSAYGNVFIRKQQ